MAVNVLRCLFKLPQLISTTLRTLNIIGKCLGECRILKLYSAIRINIVSSLLIYIMDLDDIARLWSDEAQTVSLFNQQYNVTTNKAAEK